MQNNMQEDISGEVTEQGGFFKRNWKVILEYACYLFVLVFIVYLAPTFLLEKIAIDGGSMENSLYDGEHILIEKVSRYFDGPDRFDVVVFHKPRGNEMRTYVKRIIGMPGETVQIVDGVIYIDGRELAENYGKDEMLTDGIAANPIILGENEYFVLGDHRSISMDSRDAKIGIVKKSDLDGTVIFRVYPFKAIGKVK